MRMAIWSWLIAVFGAVAVSGEGFFWLGSFLTTSILLRRWFNVLVMRGFHLLFSLLALRSVI